MVKDSRTGYQELLVARSNKRYRKICEEVQFVSKNEE